MSSLRRVSSRPLSALLAAVLALAGLLPALPAPAVAAPLAETVATSEHSAREPRNVVVRWAPGVPRTQILAAADRLGFRIVRESSKLGWAQVTSTRTGVTPQALLAALRAARLVSKAQVERIYSADTLVAPNDPLFGSQWALDNTGQTGGTAGADISAREAWSRTKGSKNVVVAVVDTGMDYQHPDLRPNVWTNPGEIPGNGVDDDGNGYVDDVHGYDFGNRDATLYDPEQGDQHATHVAGIIGAAGDNATGVAGVNWNVTIMPLKFLCWGSGTDYDGAEAIHYAVDNGADVINCSWGGSESSEMLDEAVAYAAAHGVLVVTSAGNESSDVDEWASYPGCIDSTAIINVAATDHNDELAYFSNYGSKVDLAAPGVDVTSTLPYECAGVFVDSFPYKAELLAFPLEDVSPVATSRELLRRSLGQLAPMTDSVLVVDDSEPVAMGETPGHRLGEYVDGLHAAGCTDVTTWSTESQGVPPLSVMDGRTVVWFTGAVISPFIQPMITDPEKAALGAFLDSGGRLLLSTGDGIYDMMWWDAEWAMKYFHILPNDYVTWGLGLAGLPGTAFEGVQGSLPSDLGEAASDSLLPIDDVAQPIVGLGGYGPLSGTSMAAPHVTGAAALLMAAFPSARADEIKDRLLNTTDPKPGLKSACAQGGRLNVWAAMQDAYPARPEITAPAEGGVLHAGTAETLRWTTSARASAEQTFEAQIGLPATVFQDDFGTSALAPFETNPTNGWSISWTAGGDLPSAVSGSGAGLSSMWTTVTVPEGGGDLSFSYWYDGDPWMSGGFVAVDDMENGVWYTDMPTGWTRASVRLPEGEHKLILGFIQYAFEPAADAFGVDDLSISGFDMQPLVTAPAGATSATFTPPATDIDHAKLRIRAHLGDRVTAWSDEVDVRIATDATPPATPTGFYGVAIPDGDVQIFWDGPAEPGLTYRLLRRTDRMPTGPYDASATVVSAGTGCGAYDHGMPSGTVARYALWAVDGAENVSGVTTFTATIVDEVAPDAVTKLQAGLSDGVVRLVWQAQAYPECTAVRVLRRTDTTPTGPSDPDATVVYDGSASSASDYMLTRHPFDGTAYYAVFPRDPSNNVGPASAVRLRVNTTGMTGTFTLADGSGVCTSTAVKAYSSVPGAVRMRFDLGEGYGAWRTYAATTNLVLDPPIDGMHVVKAEYENAYGSRLELEDSIFLETTPPEPPTEVKAQGWNRRVKLTWKRSRSADVLFYRITRADDPAGPFEYYAKTSSLSSALVVEAAQSSGYFRVTAIDMGGMESVPSAVIAGKPGAGVTRVAGADRYATAVEVSKRHFSSAETVVLATGENFADALSASGLAGSYDAPILLTRRDTLPPVVSAEIARLHAKRVFVIGSSSAISTAVASSLEASYTVKRIAGSNRYATAAAVARALDANETTAPAAVALVSGTSFPDGVAVSAAAYAAHMPVLLTRGDQLSPDASSTIAWLGPESVYLIGGEPTISWEVEQSLGDRVMRLAGENRYATAAYVAEFFADSGVVSFERIAVASGRTFPDALTGGAGAGKEGGVVLLTDPFAMPLPLRAMFLWRSLEVDRCEVLGGTTTITDKVKGQLQSALDKGGEIMPPMPEPVPPYEEEPGDY